MPPAVPDILHEQKARSSLVGAWNTMYTTNTHARAGCGRPLASDRHKGARAGAAEAAKN